MWFGIDNHNLIFFLQKKFDFQSLNAKDQNLKFSHQFGSMVTKVAYIDE